MRFVSIGEALVDLVAVPAQAERAPDAPATFTAHAGGSPFNVAVTLGRLGADVALCSGAGADAFGALLSARLADARIRTDLWRTGRAPTSLAVATLAADGGATYSFYLDGTAGLDFGSLRAGGDVMDFHVVHAGSIASWYGATSAGVREALARARSGGRALVGYDPNLRPALVDDPDAVRTRVEICVAAAHLVKASDEDLAYLYPRVDPAEVAGRWHRLGASLVVITRGAEGAIAFGPDGMLCDLPAPRIEVADTVGAGDSFMGGLLWALAGAGLAEPDALREAVAAADARIEAAVRTAIAVAAITTTRPGADPPTAAEVARFAEAGGGAGPAGAGLPGVGPAGAGPAATGR